MAGVPRSTGHKDSPDASSPPPIRTEVDKAATAAKLKGAQAKSPTSGAGGTKPEGMTPMQQAAQAKKPRPTKWQFGIRSRNSPAEAMLAIYKALNAMGADWEDVKARRPGGGRSPNASRERSRKGSDASQTSSDSSDEEDDDANTHHHRRRRHADDSSSDEAAEMSRPRGRERHGPWDDWGYSIPEDPWIIHARFRKDGMFPPGVIHSSSTHSSRVDLDRLSDADKERLATRRRSTAESSTTSHSGILPQPNTAAVSITSGPTASEPAAFTGPAPATGLHSSGASSGNVSLSGSASAVQRTHHSHQPDQSIYVYVTIQLYCIEREFFLVDFKCAGYERIQRRVVREVRGWMERLPGIVGVSPVMGNAERQHGQSLSGAGREEWVEIRGAEDGVGEDEEVREREELMGLGRAPDEKEVTSPFPFLDVAGRLIIQLAEAD